MAHSVIGFIVKSGFVEPICIKYPQLQAVYLEQGFSIFPLTKEMLDDFHASDSKIAKASSELTDFLLDVSTVCRLLYFETEYFGGRGSQSAIVFESGKKIFGPTKNVVGPINEGLRLLGVIKEATYDEFDSVGLGKKRHTSDWLIQK